jgi:FAD-dependent oxidoreductase domain-containing protein 1
MMHNKHSICYTFAVKLRFEHQRSIHFKMRRHSCPSLGQIAKWVVENKQTRKSSTSSQAIDTLIIGGGPVGLSTAYHLSALRKPADGDIVVLEQDPSYKSSSAMFSAGGIRQQFSLDKNIRMSLYGLDFLRNANSLLATPRNPQVDVQLQEHGYMFLASTQTGVSQMKENNQAQRQAGCGTTKLMKPEELKQAFPWLNADDILLGSYGTSGEGMSVPLR